MSAPLPALELGLTPWDFSALTATSLAAQAAYAESLGYRSFWLPENHFNAHAIPDPLMLLAAVAASTREMRLATSSYLLPLRNPLLAAEQVAVLDQLSEGRVILGVGRGYSRETLNAFAIDPGEKRELFEWAYLRMLSAWRGEAVSLHADGSAAVTVMPRPVQQPHPPIWVAAFGPKALAQVGRLGLPYLASPIEKEAARTAVNEVTLKDADTLPAGSALVDTGAGHPTCGSLSFERIEVALNRCGIKSVVIPAKLASIPVCAKGVGGVASTKEVRVVPMRLGNETVFAEVLILDNDVPPLLPATLLDRCIIDLQRNVIVWNWANKKPCETGFADFEEQTSVSRHYKFQ